MDDKVLFEFKPWLSKPVLRLYSNRVEYKLGFSNKTIPISNISDIEQSIFTKTVKLNLNSGKSITLAIPWNRSDEFINILNSLINKK